MRGIFITLYCFLPVQYLNYIFIFQLIALNCYFLYKQYIKTYVLSKTLKLIVITITGHDRTQHTHCNRHAAASITLVTEVKTNIISP